MLSPLQMYNFQLKNDANILQNSQASEPDDLPVLREEVDKV